MPREHYRYYFEDHIELDEIEDELSLARGHVDSLYGAARVQLELAYLLDEEHRSLMVDGSTEVGRDFSRLLAGSLLRTIGDDAFTVRRFEHDPRATAKEGE